MQAQRNRLLNLVAWLNLAASFVSARDFVSDVLELVLVGWRAPLSGQAAGAGRDVRLISEGHVPVEDRHVLVEGIDLLLERSLTRGFGLSVRGNGILHLQAVED